MGFVLQANETVIKSQGQDDYGKIVALGNDGKLDSSVIPDSATTQNAFSSVVVNETTIAADSQADTLELEAGTNIELTADATNEKVTIAVTGQVASAAQADSATVADSATKLATARTINGVVFDGTADITITAASDSGSTDTATKLATARTISLTGDATGSTTFDGSEDVSISIDVTSADIANKLETARTINGVSFDGSEDIVISQVDGKDIVTADKLSTAQLAIAFRNLKIQVTSNTAATITADAITLIDSSSQTTMITGVDLTLDTSASGANGLDTGTLVASTWYYLYVIYGTDGTACLMSESSTAPVLPSGYTYYSRVGAVRTNESIYLYRTIQYGNKVQYIVDGTILVGMRTMKSGVSGSYTTPTWTAIDTSAYIPPTSSLVYFSTRVSNGVIMIAPNVNYGSAESTTNPPPHVNRNTSIPIVHDFLILESIYIYYAANNSSSYLYCVGWEDTL